MKIYLVGSLKNPRIPVIANVLRAEGHDVFDEWYAAGPDADQEWQKYEKVRGRHYRDALYGLHARTVFGLDYMHLASAEAGVLVMPAGKSGHLEIGWLAGRGTPTFILFENGEPERFDVMYLLNSALCFSVKEVVQKLA